MIGSLLKNTFRICKTDQNDFVQYTINFGDKTFIFLDTNLSGTDSGCLCAKKTSMVSKYFK